jgi:hypothetical protein
MQHGAEVKIGHRATPEQIDRAKVLAHHMLAHQAKLSIEDLLRLPIEEEYRDNPIEGGQYYRIYVET